MFSRNNLVFAKAWKQTMKIMSIIYRVKIIYKKKLQSTSIKCVKVKSKYTYISSIFKKTVKKGKHKLETNNQAFQRRTILQNERADIRVKLCGEGKNDNKPFFQ